ncbi:unnamed protein product, partial [marine sediment metagenome]
RLWIEEDQIWNDERLHENIVDLCSIKKGKLLFLQNLNK